MKTVRIIKYIKHQLKFTADQAQSTSSFEELPNRSNLKATSMPEILVTMIIAGILYIFIFDGMDMLMRFSGRVQTAFIDKTTLMISHGIMEKLFEKTDSITEEEGIFHLHSEGNLYRTIERRSDKLLLSTTDPAMFPDTLFRNLSDIVYRHSKSHYRIDSLFLVITSGGDTLSLKYGLTK